MRQPRRIIAVRGTEAPAPVGAALRPATEELLRRLELTVSRRLDGLLQGDYQGLLPGAGTEAGDARQYQPGDDVRHIDWNLTARTAEAQVRMPIADHELETWALVDLSASLAFGTAGHEKRDLAVAMVAALGYLTARTGNRIGALVVEPDRRWSMPARSGRRHLQALLHRVASSARHDGGGTTDLGAALGACGRLAGRRGLVVVVSDFMATDGWERPLRSLTTRHDVVAVEVLDPRELELPDVGVVSLVDPETGQRLEVQTADGNLRARYAQAAAAQRQSNRRAIRRAGADHLVVRTDGDWLADLVAFVGRRRHRRLAAAGSAAPGSTTTGRR